MKKNYSVNWAGLCTKTNNLVLHEIFRSLEKGWSFRDKGFSTNNFRHTLQILAIKSNSSPQSSPLLVDNIKLHGMPTRIKWKMQPCFTLNFKFWEGTFVKSYKIQLPVFLFLVLHEFFYHFYNFLEFHSTLSEKIFIPNFPFLTGSPPPPSHNSNSLMAKICKTWQFFCQFSLKYLLKHFFFQKFFNKIFINIF